MKKLILAFLLSAVALAADPIPTLASLREGYDREIAAAAQARKAKITELTAAYMKLLDEAVANATDAAAAAAIKLEREGIAKGLLAPGKIPGLPQEIASAHLKFFGAAAQASVDFANAKKKSDAGYLTALSKLVAKNKSNKELLHEVAAERRRVKYGGP